MESPLTDTEVVAVENEELRARVAKLCDVIQALATIDRGWLTNAVCDIGLDRPRDPHALADAISTTLSVNGVHADWCDQYELSHRLAGTVHDHQEHAEIAAAMLLRFVYKAISTKATAEERAAALDELREIAPVCGIFFMAVGWDRR